MVLLVFKCKLKTQLAEFDMKDLGPTNKILGMQIHRNRKDGQLWLSQKNYLRTVLRCFNMHDYKPNLYPTSCEF